MNNIITEFYIASGTDNGGAYRYALYGDMNLVRRDKINISNPQWIEIDGGRLCAVFRNAIHGDGYAEYSLETGKRITEIIPTIGKNVCHFCKQGSDVYFANYDDGIVSKNGVKSVLQSGKFGPLKQRQKGPHAHQCIFSPNKKFVLTCDLGLDAIIVYDRELNEISRANVLSGHGVRHAVFSANGAKLYALTELGSTIAEFLWDGESGSLSYKATYDLLETEAKGDGAEIVLSCDGQHIYATNRSNNKTKDYICHFIVGETLTLVSRISSMGNHPRHFCLINDGKYAVCCNTFGGSIALFKVKSDGELDYITSTEVPYPMCVGEIL